MKGLGSKKVFAQQSKFGRWYQHKFLSLLQASWIGILMPVVIAVLTTVAFVGRYGEDMRNLEREYIGQRMSDTHEVSSNITQALGQVHTGLRTVALNNELHRIAKQPLQIETQAAISQIFSNLSLSLNIDSIEVQVAGKTGLEKTYTFTAATGMLSTPVEAKKISNDHEDKGEVYRWFSEKFPRNAYASLMDFPARLVGSDHLHYSVPFFNDEGKIQGLVTCNIPSSALTALISSPNIALVDPVSSTLIYNGEPGSVESSKEYVLKGSKVPNVIYSEAFAVPIADKLGNWTVWTQQYDEEFYKQDNVVDTKRGLFIALLSVWMIAVATILAIQNLKHRQERRFQNLVRNSQELILVIDASGKVIHTIGQVKKQTGWEQADLKDLSLDLFLDPMSKSVLRQLLVGVTEGEHLTETGEIVLEQQAGGYVWYEATATNMLEEPGIGGILLTLRNIEARKSSERMMVAAKDAAERANEAKSEFLSRMSHELRTPLNAILGFGQLLEMGTLDKRDSESVEQIMKAGRHLLNLVNDILDIARIETRKISLSIESVNCDSVVSEAVSLIAPLANREKIQIFVDCSEDLYTTADNQRLKQVLLNLLSNAVKYNKAEGEVYLNVEQHGSAIHFSVRDTGKGIDANGLRRLFTPFDRLGADRSTIEGSGLGLALSKTMVEAMGGQIDVESVIGDGTTFTIILAADVQAESPKPVKGTPLTIVEGGPVQKLLYIEDNLANLKLVRDILEMHPGYNLLTAVQGGMGIEMAELHQPDIILLDLDLPDISGMEVLKSLRENEKTADAKIIVMSADATEHKVQRVFELGADDYLAKPINIKRFMSLIQPTRRAA
jgi:PAS domain S-box-containing protein